eukprot:TRINITY_DN26129_c0_g1_i1.p1 TRINITY_DN26129_c0_g1~~TRINITY_DN26129_c0_g1_i1.p1  ORF type:complete len:531 (+),score=99.51 TRINITY_DN26129_c0_g1_i1:60-1652(+)
MGKRRAAAGESRAAAGYACQAAPPAKSPAKVIAFYSDREGNQFREFSNFFRHRQPFEFHLPTLAQRSGFPTSLWCSFSEKAIMATKAALMGDLEIFHEIEQAVDPKDCKSLGRGVRNFDEGLWQKHLEEVAFEVVRQKFDSEKSLRELLLSTGDKILAEAAPRDAIWGIGLPSSDPRSHDPSQWCGRNILGYALMRARKHFRSRVQQPSGSSAAEASPVSSGDTDSQQQPCTSFAQAPHVSSADTDSQVQQPVTSAMEAPHVSSAGTGKPSKRWGKAKSKVTANVEPKPETGAICLVDSAVTVPTAALAPTQCGGCTSESLFDYFVVLDFEATCDDGRRLEPQEIIEFPMLLVDATTGRVQSEFRSYVKPHHHPQLTSFCTQLTGIQQRQIDQAPKWQAAFLEGQAWLDGQLDAPDGTSQSCLFVTCGDWDLKTMLPRQCLLSSSHVPQRFKQWLNIKELFRKTTGKPGAGMPSMLQKLGLELEGKHHSGLDDCRNIARILAELLRTGVRVSPEILSSSESSFTAQVQKR